MKKRNRLFLLLVIGVFILGFFLRFYRFWDIPPGLNQDETAIGYNAYTVMRTGKDEWGKSFPVYFRSFGDYKLPIYIYSVVPFVKIFGLTSFAVRFPSVLAGSITVILFYYLILFLSKNKWYSLLAAFFLSLNPWNLFFSRAAFEDNLALLFAMLGFFLLLHATESKKSFYFLIGATVSFIASLYSYNVTRLLVPVLVICNMFIFRKKLHVTKQQGITLSLIMLFLLSPFFLTFFSKEGAFSAKGALITSSDIMAKSIEMKSYVRVFSRIMGVLLFNNVWYTPWQFLQNIVGFLSPTFFFLTGSLHGTQGIGNTGMFYLAEFPFIIAGIAVYVKKRISFLRPFFWWAIITLLVASLSKEVPHATRGYFLVIPLTTFSAYGLYNFLLWKGGIKKILLYFVLAFVVSYGFVNYFVSYYLRFPVLYAKEWQSEDKKLAAYLQAKENDYAEIIIDPDTGFRYTSLLFYQKVDPDIFLKNVLPATPNTEGLIWGRSFNKYMFRHIEWPVDYKREHVLLVAPADKINDKTMVLKIFKLPKRPVVISFQEQIGSFTEEVPVYAVIRSDPKTTLFQ